MVTASIVSHGHGRMVADLAEDLLACPEIAKIVITQNIAEEEDYPRDDRIRIRRNGGACGYGANQNATLLDATTPFLCVLNPDIRLSGNPFPALLRELDDPRLAACAPVITTPDGAREDSARKFPTALSLVGKALGLVDGTYPDTTGMLKPDWLAGMFLLLRSSSFREVAGFDEKYFLYYEDVDLSWRLRRRGYELRQVPEASAVHNARRASRRDWRYARWHLASMTRFLARSAFR
jgi:N-acetylglucosaminyl-diphospho-decaprenol L-rhamnosyltransferase